MDYQYQYDKLIEKSTLNEETIKQKYYEKHHIIPKCMGGSDDKDNIVCLSAKAHFVAHHLLCKAHPTNTKLAFAFHLMCFHNSSEREKLINCRLFEKAKTHFKRLHPNRSKPRRILKEYKCDYCGSKLETRNKFCDKTCHDSWQKDNFNRTPEAHDKMVKRIRTYFKNIDPVKKKKWLENSIHSDKVDHIARGKKISESKKGKPTKQYEIMGKRFANMSDTEFDTYLQGVSERTHTRFRKLRTKWKSILQSEN